MRLLYHSRWVTVVAGRPRYLSQWWPHGTRTWLAVRRGPKGGFHLLFLGACVGLRFLRRGAVAEGHLHPSPVRDEST